MHTYLHIEYVQHILHSTYNTQSLSGGSFCVHYSPTELHWLGGKKILAGSSQLYIGPVLVSGDHKEFKVQKQTLKTNKNGSFRCHIHGWLFS